MQITLIIHNIRSCYNVGAILRTAEGFGVNKVILSGYTSRIKDARLLPHLRDKLDREIHKTALGAEEMLDIYASDDIFSDIERLRTDGYQIIGLENNITVRNLYTLNDISLREKLADKVALILGEEVAGINPSLYDLIDLFIEIPMKGRKESFNVSVATGIALYKIAADIVKK
ncbi:MAG: TrmH family RNA methyltransferase [Candidatus Saccharibacteria bacterium]|nr:TrmH family RNA methyltransferase [Candidatus Saccharibacteria bacterium]